MDQWHGQDVTEHKFQQEPYEECNQVYNIYCVPVAEPAEVRLAPVHMLFSLVPSTAEVFVAGEVCSFHRPYDHLGNISEFYNIVMHCANVHCCILWNIQRAYTNSWRWVLFENSINLGSYEGVRYSPPKHGQPCSVSYQNEPAQTCSHKKLLRNLVYILQPTMFSAYPVITTGNNRTTILRTWLSKTPGI